MFHCHSNHVIKGKSMGVINKGEFTNNIYTGTFSVKMLLLVKYYSGHSWTCYTHFVSEWNRCKSSSPDLIEIRICNSLFSVHGNISFSKWLIWPCAFHTAQNIGAEMTRNSFLQSPLLELKSEQHLKVFIYLSTSNLHFSLSIKRNQQVTEATVFKFKTTVCQLLRE